MEYEETPVVEVDDKSELLRCAKDYNHSECGYKSAATVCGKCGALPAALEKATDENDTEEKGADEEIDMAESEKRHRKPQAADQTGAGPEEEEEEELPPAAAPGGPPPPPEAPPGQAPPGPPPAEEAPPGPPPAAAAPPPPAAAPAPAAEEEEGDAPPPPPRRRVPPEEEEEEVMSARQKDEKEKQRIEETVHGQLEDEKAANPFAADDDDEEEEEADGEDEDEDEEEKNYGNYRKRRLQKMGQKSETLNMNGYVCAIERKVYAGTSPVCDDCPGGCVSEKGLPGLLEIEGLAETEFDGDVIDSGYSQDADMYVVDLATKDDRAIEVFIDGSSAEVLGFHRLDDSVLEQKSLEDDIEFIDFSEAADIATKSIPGEIISVEPDVFEGFDCYAVEIDGIDGKSYDVFVALDGITLGHDAYEADEAEEIEAEAAEIALKRAFSDEKREEMAGSGQALPDGSYPIASENDLKNAIQAFGRAKNKDEAKRHIMKRAKALGLSKLIPVNWVSGSEKAIQVDDEEFMASLIEFQLLSSEDA